MDDAVLVRVLECIRDRYRDADRFVHRELLFTVQKSAQRLAFDEWHDVEQQSACVARVEERQQIWMLKIRRDSNLRQKALGAEDGAQLRVEHFDRDFSVVLDIV